MRRFEVAERSMAPALLPGDYLVSVAGRRPRRGAVVVFPFPGDPGRWLVKRVVGLPGETVEIAGGTILVDGDPLVEPWTTDDTGPPGRWTLGATDALVLSDARTRTLADSRTFGPVPTTGLWTVVYRYWPLARVGRVP